MSIWVKICGNTSLADAQFAVDAGADAVGFVFAPSPRRVTPSQVAAITPGLAASIEKIGVFVETPLDEIAETVRLCGLSGVQLHSEAGSDLPAQLRAEFGPSLRILRVVHFAAGAEQKAAALSRDPNVACASCRLTHRKSRWRDGHRFRLDCGVPLTLPERGRAEAHCRGGPESRKRRHGDCYTGAVGRRCRLRRRSRPAAKIRISCAVSSQTRAPRPLPIRASPREISLRPRPSLLVN